MLLDPLKEQLHLPACLIERAEGGCRQDEVVGQEHQRLAGLVVFKADAAQMRQFYPGNQPFPLRLPKTAL